VKPTGSLSLRLGSIAPSRQATWIAIQVTFASIALLAVAVSTPVRPAIAFDWPGLPPDVSVSAGLTFWLAFGLLGGVRTRLQPGGGVVTFSMPFIVAGSVLGGPLAGGLMGLVSELEVRELRTSPWYGLISNHAVGVIAAVAAGSAATGVQHVVGLLPAGQAALGFFAAVMVAGLVFTVVNVGLVVPTLALRNDLTLREAFRVSDATFRATSVAEVILAWNLAVAYQAVGWWAPIAIVALVLTVWQAFDRGEALRHDPMTGLLNDLGFRPFLAAAVDAAVACRRQSAFLSLDLDGLWEVNLGFGSAAGDQFLRVAAERILRALRATDSVCRRLGTGDEFLGLLADIPDLAAALRVAERIRAAVGEPIHLRGRNGTESFAGGISIGIVLIECGTTMSAEAIAELAERRLQQAKVLGGAIVADGDGPTEADQQAHRDKKALKRGDDGPAALPSPVVKPR
jgi:diguanylate cyclase (GGDEF)-like protein